MKIKSVTNPFKYQDAYLCQHTNSLISARDFDFVRDMAKSSALHDPGEKGITECSKEGPSAPDSDWSEADVHQTHRTRPEVDFWMMPIHTSAGNEKKVDTNVNYGLY